MCPLCVADMQWSQPKCGCPRDAIVCCHDCCVDATCLVHMPPPQPRFLRFFEDSDWEDVVNEVLACDYDLTFDSEGVVRDADQLVVGNC